MLLNRLPIERIYLRHLGHATVLRNLLRHRLKRRMRAPNQKHPRPRTPKGPSHCTAHIPSRSVDHRVFVLKQHILPPTAFSATTLHRCRSGERRLPSQTGATSSCNTEAVQFGPHPLQREPSPTSIPLHCTRYT